MSWVTAAACPAGYCVSIRPDALSPYTHGETSVTASRCASTAVVPCWKFQYGMDATTSVCRAALPRRLNMVTPTATAPASTTASHAAPAMWRRDRPGARAGAGLRLRYAVLVSPAIPLSAVLSRIGVYALMPGTVLITPPPAGWLTARPRRPG